VKRQVRTILPLGRGGRILRFSGKSRSTDRGDGERMRPRDDDDLYRALGRIAANWSLIEIASGMVLMELVGSSDETLARAVVAGQRVENVWETIEALLAANGTEDNGELSAFRTWRRSANRYRRRRNEAIHSAWALTPGSEGPAAWDVMSQKAKRGARPDLFPGGVSELEELARDIASCEGQLTALKLTTVVVASDSDDAVSDQASLDDR
jgi:hypothetical protein